MTTFYSMALILADFTTIGLCIVLKVPQILSLLKSKSATGISLQSLLLELTAYTIGFCYSVCNKFPLTSYLEYPCLIVQDVIVIAMVLHYSGILNLTSLASFGAYSAIVYAISSGMFHPSLITILLSMCVPISAASKIAQLRALHVSQNSESVSTLTWSLAASTCITRIFTTLDRGFDVPLLLNYSVSLVLNICIVLLALHLRRPKSLMKKTE